MPTEALPWLKQTEIDSPWRRLRWTLPLALLICAITFTWFAYSMKHPSDHAPEPIPVTAELVEMPAQTPSASPQKTVAQPITKQPERPPLPPPLPAEQPGASAAPPASTPPPPAPAAAPQAANNPPVAGETRGAHAIIQPLPVIPDELRQDEMSESAVARFQIAADGTTTVELIKPTQNPRLNRLLLDTLRTWKFFPAMKEGKPVASVEEKVIRVNVK